MIDKIRVYWTEINLQVAEDDPNRDIKKVGLLIDTLAVTYNDQVYLEGIVIDEEDGQLVPVRINQLKAEQ